jgi:serine protease Do
LREGDVILSVGNIEVSSVKEFESAVAKADKSKALSVLFRRGEWAQYALIRPAR